MKTGGKTFEFGYMIYEEVGKVLLLIVDKVFEIKRIDRSISPARMTIIDDSGDEILYQATSKI